MINQNKKQQEEKKAYEQKNPKKAQIIQRAVKRGLKEYEETFRKLAIT